MDISGMFVKMHDERLLFTGRQAKGLEVIKVQS